MYHPWSAAEGGLGHRVMREIVKTPVTISHIFTALLIEVFYFVEEFYQI